MKSFNVLKRKLLKNKELREGYERLGPEYTIIEAIIRRRLKDGLTQAQLARKVGTKQSSISRLESGGYNPTLAFLQKIGKALGKELVINFK